MSAHPLTERQQQADERARLRLSAARKAMGLTLEDFADWLGVHVATLNNSCSSG